MPITTFHDTEELNQYITPLSTLDKRMIATGSRDHLNYSWVGTSLVAQWLRIHLPMQGTWVGALVREDLTGRSHMLRSN